jgi:hypothetical protein
MSNVKEEQPTDVPFQAVPYEIAKAISRRVQFIYKEKGDEWKPKGPNGCQICDHDKREVIDTLLLMGANYSAIRRAMGESDFRSKWTRARFMRHRDYHLRPLIEAEVNPASVWLRMLPYPNDGDRQTKGWWYLLRCQGMMDEAQAANQLGTALNCLKEMRAIDMEMLARSPRQVSRDLTALAGAAEPGSKLERAFKRSVRKEAITNGDGTESGDDAEAQARPSAEGEARREQIANATAIVVG